MTRERGGHMVGGVVGGFYMWLAPWTRFGVKARRWMMWVVLMIVRMASPSSNPWMVYDEGGISLVCGQDEVGMTRDEGHHHHHHHFYPYGYPPHHHHHHHHRHRHHHHHHHLHASSVHPRVFHIAVSTAGVDASRMLGEPQGVSKPHLCPVVDTQLEGC